AEPIPAIERLSMTANGVIIHATPTLPAIWLTACTMPCNTLMSFLPIATSSEASSSPTKPKPITPNEFRTNLGSAGIRKSAVVTVVPKRDKTVNPKPIRTAAATNVPMAPTLLSHFPTPRPTMFTTVSSSNNNTDVTIAKFLLSASAAWPGPIANTVTPTKYNITVGTYSMLLVQ